MSSERLSADFIVAGAGPAGLTAARLLALKGRSVVVIDPFTPTVKRLELLAPASLDTIKAVGLAALLDDPSVARPCQGIRRRWNSVEPDYEDFLRHPYRTGYVVDRSRFDDCLRLAATNAGVKFLQARITRFESRKGVRVKGNDGSSRVFDFGGVIVDATGRAAMIARRKGARVRCRDRMVAELVEQFTTGRDPTSAGWLDVLKDGAGWSYSLRGPGGRGETWRVRRLTENRAPSALRQVDASAGILSAAAGERWIAIGDAAIAFDPIASQGLFNALSSARIATGALISKDGLNAVTARMYSDAVAATFYRSEAGRSAVYDGAAAAARPVCK